VRIRTRTRDALGLLALTLMTAASVRAADFETVFSLDQKFQPVTSLDRASPMSDGLRAILALYAFEAGAGCTTYTRDHEELQCALTRDLGLGAQCSLAHLNLIASWFKNGMPAFGWLTDAQLRRAQQTNELSGRCYNQPDGATLQSTWEHVGVDRMGCAWLIRKHIDPKAKFQFVPVGTQPLPADAEPFDAGAGVGVAAGSADRVRRVVVRVAEGALNGSA